MLGITTPQVFAHQRVTLLPKTLQISGHSSRAASRAASALRKDFDALVQRLVEGCVRDPEAVKARLRLWSSVSSKDSNAD